MSIKEHRALIAAGTVDVDMPAVPAGHTRHVTTIQAANKHADTDALLTVEIYDGGSTFALAPALEIVAGDARAALVGPLTLEAGDVLRFAASADGMIEAVVSYHDRAVPA